MTVDIYADLFVMTPLSAVAPAVGHLLAHSLPSVCSIRPSFPPPPFSFIHAQRPLINALAKKASHLFVVLPSADAGAVIFIMRNCRHIKWSPDDDSWQAARVACPRSPALPPPRPPQWAGLLILKLLQISTWAVRHTLLLPPSIMRVRRIAASNIPS